MKVKTEEGKYEFEGEYSYSDAEGLFPFSRWYLFLNNPKTKDCMGLSFEMEEKDLDSLDHMIEDLQKIRNSFPKKEE